MELTDHGLTNVVPSRKVARVHVWPASVEQKIPNRSSVAVSIPFPNPTPEAPAPATTRFGVSVLNTTLLKAMPFRSIVNPPAPLLAVLIRVQVAPLSVERKKPRA